MKKFAVLAVLAVLFTSAVPALALSSFQTLPFSFDVPGNQTLSFNQFDSSLGTLTKVTLDIIAYESVNMTAENDSAVAGNISITLSGNVTGSGGGLSVLALISNTEGPVAVGATDSVPQSGPDFYDFGTVQGSDTDSDFIPPGSLVPFIGLGTINIDVAGTAAWSFSGVTAATLRVSDQQAWGDATITYEYTNVPEPGTIAMMVMGGFSAAGAGVIRKLRK